MTGIDASIRSALSSAAVNRVFSAADFGHLGNRAAIDKVLSRLVVQGELRRISRGLYHVPKDHPVLGQLLPEASAITDALAAKLQLRLQPSGSYAANLLGLTEQVPLKLVFLTDGPSKTLHVGHQTFVLKHTTPRNMATAGRISGLVIQALRHLGKENIGPHTIALLSSKLTSNDKMILLQDARLAPVWIANIMRDIAQDKP